ncbi:MAG: M28 family peptidase [Gammaproteobacteria bacterium]|nr:M28 family peptidase [Gammaproteobacteria bacterium]
MIWLIVLAAGLAAGAGWMTWMPGKSVRGPLPVLSDPERKLSGRLESDVRTLSVEIGERNVFTPDSMSRTVDWIEERMREAGYSPQRRTYELGGSSATELAGHPALNLVAELPGSERPGEVVIIGAHYDSVVRSPGANDNASGIAALLALAEWFRERPQPRTIRFVAFANEEPPMFASSDMGSHAYAAHSRGVGEGITAMMSMDGIAYFSDEPGSQRYPLPGLDLIYPTRGNFIGFVTRAGDARLLREAIGAFREQASIPSEGAALPGGMPGVGWSDHWAFWQHDYSAFLVTDTLPFRDPHYHTPGDTADRLDYDRLARVVHGLKAVIAKLAGA